MAMRLRFSKLRKDFCRMQRGFTLLELLTVIGIIALLLGILLPVVNKARTLAQRTVCRANLHNVALAFRMYLDQYNDIMPPACQLPSESEKPPIAEFLMPFLQDPKSLKCPGDTGVEEYFRRGGSSYEYNAALGGRKVSKISQIKRYGETNVHIMRDYESFHGTKGKVGSVNYLYVNGRVGDYRSE